MRIRQVKTPEEYRQPKSNSFSPLTRPTTDTSLVEGDYIDLNSPNFEEEELSSDLEDVEQLQDIQSLQTVAQFLADSREHIFDNIPKDLLEAASSTNKILIDNLPPRLPEDEFQKIFHRFGGAHFSHVYTSRLFEVGQHQMLPSDISDLNKGAKRWSQVQKVKQDVTLLTLFQAIKSDSYAFVVLSTEGYQKATRDDLKLFGCSIKVFNASQ